MDSYTIEDVDNLINSNRLTPEILSIIFKNTTRNIEIHGSVESILLFEHLKENSNIPIDVRKEIKNFLAVYHDCEKSNSENKSSINKTSVSYLVIGVLLLVSGIIIFLSLR